MVAREGERVVDPDGDGEVGRKDGGDESEDECLEEHVGSVWRSLDERLEEKQLARTPAFYTRTVRFCVAPYASCC